MKAPTPLELMAFADGELDDVRREEVTAWLAAHPEGVRVVRAIGEIGALVETASASQAPVDVADDVLSAIDRIEAAERNAIIASTPPPPSASRVRTLHPAPLPRSTSRFGAAMLVLGLAAAAAVLFVLRSNATNAPLAGPIASIGKVPALATPASEDDAAHGTDVDAVDFGAHQGAIFYVPGQANTSTVVVWISDEAPR